jgi:xylulokinase
MNFDDLLWGAETTPAGSEGLQFMPYLSREPTPHPDPLARGAFIGLTIRHGRGHLANAVLEGVSFGLKDSFTLIQNAGLGGITQMRASGGERRVSCGGRSWLRYWKRNW